MPNPNSYQFEEHFPQYRAKKVVILNSLGTIVDGFTVSQLTVNNNAVAVYNSTSTTLLSGATVGLQVDSSGALIVTKGTLDAGEDLINNRQIVEQRFPSVGLTSLTTLLAKNGAGVFKSFNIGMPSCPTIAFYDSLIPGVNLIQRIAAGYPMGTHTLNISLSTGLSVDPIIGGGGVIPTIQMSVR